MQQTPLNTLHRDFGARMVDFGGWDMPLHYGSQLEEHHQVRRHAGLFDVSHMTVVDLRGAQTRAFLRHLLANDVNKLKVSGKALYTCMLTDSGGVIDDLIVYYLDEDNFRLVVNAATREKDLAWISTQAAAFSVVVMERPELAMIAIQGPQARALFAQTLSSQADRDAVTELGRFAAVTVSDQFVARTGYTGEDGFEVILPADAAEGLWRKLHALGAANIGLGARDTLRLEAGLNLYGQDMDETTSPLESGLAWTVALDTSAGPRQFIGADALREQQRGGVARALIGLVLRDKPVLRHGYLVHDANGVVGEVTSGSFSPTLQCSIALARVASTATEPLTVDIRGRQYPVQKMAAPFVRAGKPTC